MALASEVYIETLLQTSQLFQIQTTGIDSQHRCILFPMFTIFSASRLNPILCAVMTIDVVQTTWEDNMNQTVMIRFAISFFTK